MGPLGPAVAAAAQAVKALLLVAVTLVELQGPDGQKIYVNPNQIISVRSPRGVGYQQGHWPPGTRCLLVTVDGKMVLTLDTCDTVRRKLTEAGHQPD